MHVGLHEIGLLSSYIPNERVWAYRIWSLFPGRERESLSHCRIVLCISLVNSRNWHRRWHFIRLRWNKERVPLLRVYLMHVRATRIVIPFVPSRFISNGFREHSLCACFMHQDWDLTFESTDCLTSRLISASEYIIADERWRNEWGSLNRFKCQSLRSLGEKPLIIPCLSVRSARVFGHGARRLMRRQRWKMKQRRNSDLWPHWSPWFVLVLQRPTFYQLPCHCLQRWGRQIVESEMSEM